MTLYYFIHSYDLFFELIYFLFFYLSDLQRNPFLSLPLGLLNHLPSLFYDSLQSMILQSIIEGLKFMPERLQARELLQIGHAAVKLWKMKCAQVMKEL